MWTFLTHTCITRWMGWENRWETHTQPSLCLPALWAASLLRLGQPPVRSVLLEALQMDGVCEYGDKMTLPDHSWAPDRTGQPSSHVRSTFSHSSQEICLSYNCPHYSITLYWEKQEKVGAAPLNFPACFPLVFNPDSTQESPLLLPIFPRWKAPFPSLPPEQRFTAWTHTGITPEALTTSPKDRAAGLNVWTAGGLEKHCAQRTYPASSIVITTPTRLCSLPSVPSTYSQTQAPPSWKHISLIPPAWPAPVLFLPFPSFKEWPACSTSPSLAPTNLRWHPLRLALQPLLWTTAPISSCSCQSLCSLPSSQSS